MKTFVKIAAATALAGALAMTAVTPSQARHGRNAAAAIGFGAGALIGAAAANAANNGYYADDGYYYGGPGYAYGEPGYAYEGSYAYAPAPVYYGSHYRYRSGRSNPNCGSDLGSAKAGCN